MLRLLSLLLAAAPVLAQLSLPTDFQAVALDANGFIYVAGTTSDRYLPVTPGVLQATFPSGSCGGRTCRHGYVAKVAPSGDRLIWATYFGGNGEDSISELALDQQGNPVIAGATTSTNLPVSATGYRREPASLFVAKLSADGRRLLAGTYFGGTDKDSIGEMKLDAAGNVYLAGGALSSPFPTTPGAYRRERNLERPDPLSTGPDQFLAKLSPDVSALVFSTLIPFAGPDRADGVALGADGTIYVAGTRGVERNSPVHPMVTRMAPDGSAVVYSTELPTPPAGYGAYAVAVDAQGQAYAAGGTYWATYSSWGAVWKLDAQGRPAGSHEFEGGVQRLEVSGAEVIVEGYAPPGKLTLTPGAAGVCQWSLSSAPFLARLDTATLTPSYVGYVGKERIWLLGTGQILGVDYFPRRLQIISAGPPPPGTVTCVANAASYDAFSIAPGEVVSVFGNQIGPAAPMGAQVDAEGNITRMLGGITVLVGGLPAPLLYAGPDQINLVVPFGILGDPVAIDVRRGEALGEVVEKRVSATRVGIFTADGSGAGQLAALNQDGSANSVANPAAPGSVVSIFATGLGAMSPWPIDGSRPGGPFSQPIAPVLVTVGGKEAVIEYIGNAPTLVQGVVQVNIRLPDVPAGNPLVVLRAGHPDPSHGGVDGYGSSHSGTIAVR